MRLCVLFFFFFKQKTAYEMRISDWSSDVCSSDLRRRLVSLEIWAGHYDAPLDEREIARHYTLTSDDLEIVGRRRGDATRLGFAMLLLTKRWQGRALEAAEVPHAPVAGERKSDVEGKNVSVRVDLGGRGNVNNKTKWKTSETRK